MRTEIINFLYFVSKLNQNKTHDVNKLCEILISQTISVLAVYLLVSLKMSISNEDLIMWFNSINTMMY